MAVPTARGAVVLVHVVTTVAVARDGYPMELLVDSIVIITEGLDRMIFWGAGPITTVPTAVLAVVPLPVTMDGAITVMEMPGAEDILAAAEAIIPVTVVAVVPIMKVINRKT